jgi:hypothetical protein
MELLLCNEKLQRIKVYSLASRLLDRSIAGVYFNTHFELTWAEMPQTECLTNLE